MLYIHIPFCKSRCIYCNFFSTTKLELRRRYVEALIKQLEAIKLSKPSNLSNPSNPSNPSKPSKPSKPSNLSNKPFASIYLGGGTPSVLPINDLRRLLLAAKGVCDTPLQEFTVECNPDDVTPELAEALTDCGVNRISLGVQTFDDERLRFINRRHNAQKAREAVAILRAYNINNVSIDLMFGFPGETLEDWQRDIREAIVLNPPHISAYCLTVEEGTMLHRMLNLEPSNISKPSNPSNLSNQSNLSNSSNPLRTSITPLPDEALLEQMYYTLARELKAAGYDHYEISNFCKPGYHSRHNSGYWQDKPYLALGAGAHGYEVQSPKSKVQNPESKVQSFRTRYWNIADIEEYIRRVENGESVIEGSESIDPTTHYNDLITTAMRTARGLSSDFVSQHCSPTLADYFLQTARRLEAQGLLEEVNPQPSTVNSQNTTFRLHPEKLFVSDDILAEMIKL